MILLVFINSKLCCYTFQSCDFFLYHNYARLYLVWFSARAPGGLVINLIIYLYILEQEVKFILTLTIPKKTVTQLSYCYQFITFELTRSSEHFYLLQCRTNIRKFSISFQGPNFFNSLSFEIRNATSTTSFCCKLKAFLLS